MNPAHDTMPSVLRLAMRTGSGQDLGALDLRPRQMLPLYAEVWRDCLCFKGMPSFAPGELEFAVDPGGSGRQSAVSIRVRVRGGDGAVRAKTFTPHAFVATVQDHCAQFLTAPGASPEGLQVAFDVCAADGSGAWLAPFNGIDPKPKFHRYPLERLLSAAAECAASLPPGPFRVVYTCHALAEAERFSRAGRLAVPVVQESGAMLLGRVCLSPATGQGYVVVTDALPIQAADADTYSLTLSAESWARIHRYVAARADSGLELIGLAHGHNFPPGAEEGDCETCPKRFTCGRHTAFISDDDRRFLQAVFPLQRNPCQLAHVWGLDPMHASHDALFLVEDGGLRQSPYAVIEMLPDDFMNP